MLELDEGWIGGGETHDGSVELLAGQALLTVGAADALAANGLPLAGIAALRVEGDTDAPGGAGDDPV